MKRFGLFLTIFALCGLSIAAQDLATRGRFYQSFGSRDPGVASYSQVSEFSVGNSVWFAAYENSFDNLTNVTPFDSRAGANPELTFTYNSGPVVRGYFTQGGGSYINHVFANADNPNESTQMTVVIAPHAIPKMRARNAVVSAQVTFTATGRVSIFSNVGTGVPPEIFRTFTGQGTGTITYSRINGQLTTKFYRQMPNPKVIVTSISLDFVAPQ